MDGLIFWSIFLIFFGIICGLYSYITDNPLEALMATIALFVLGMAYWTSTDEKTPKYVTTLVMLGLLFGLPFLCNGFFGP